MTVRKIILASSSPYRREMLERIKLPFAHHAPHIDETPLANETASALVARLALGKAKAVAAQYPNDLIIGADQVADCGGEILGKPGNHENAVAQLRKMSAAEVTLYCGLVLLDAASGQYQSAVEPFTAAFRPLDDAVIERYLRAEKPFDCCGGLKAEGPGIALLTRLEGADPNALLGLPLIRLIDMLKKVGVELV